MTVRKQNTPAKFRTTCWVEQKTVKVGLKSSSSPDKVVTAEVIYEILLRYFSDSPESCLPLADFYSTLPFFRESPVDYWVRLNNAAEIADKHLLKQGSQMNNISQEVAMMFIRNCPDTGLSNVFKYKPATKWSFAEVQEAIDEHQRELRSSTLTLNLTIHLKYPILLSATQKHPLWKTLQ